MRILHVAPFTFSVWWGVQLAVLRRSQSSVSRVEYIHILPKELGIYNLTSIVGLNWRYWHSMFYSQLILAKKGPLGKIWLAAHWDKKLTKNQIYATDITESVGTWYSTPNNICDCCHAQIAYWTRPLLWPCEFQVTWCLELCAYTPAKWNI